MTTMNEINPEKVYALVVGIETYKAGSGYDLDGPANDALKFTDWLLTHQVKPENVLCFLSPLDKNQDVLSKAQARGLIPQDANRDEIDGSPELLGITFSNFGRLVVH